MSNSLVKVESDTYHYFANAIVENLVLDSQILGNEFWVLLKRKHFIIDNDEDEYLIYASTIMRLRQQRIGLWQVMARVFQMHAARLCRMRTEHSGKFEPGAADVIAYSTSISELTTARYQLLSAKYRSIFTGKLLALYYYEDIETSPADEYR